MAYDLQARNQKLIHAVRQRAAQYDAILAQYKQVYDRVGLPIRHYADIDEMIADYTKP